MVGAQLLLNQNCTIFKWFLLINVMGSVTFFGGLVWISFILCNEELCKFGIVDGKHHEAWWLEVGVMGSLIRRAFGKNLLNLGQIAPVNVVVEVFCVM